MWKYSQNKRGFTLIELLIVIAVMAILTTVVFVALNPTARFQDARNSRRWTDINSIIGAIKLRQVDDGGNYIQDVSNLTKDKYYQIGSGAGCGGADICKKGADPITLEDNCVDLTNLNDATKSYLPSIPFDPQSADAAHTKYYLLRSDTGAITVGACNAEKGSDSAVKDISITR